MLQENLERASRETSKRRSYFVATAVAAVVIVALALTSLSLWDSLRRQQNKAEEISPAATPVIAKTSAAQPLSLPVENTLVKTDADREHFKESVRSFESELEPKLEEANLKVWNKGKLHEIQTLKDQAISAFSVGEYNAALALINKATAESKTTLVERNAILRKSLIEASASLKEGNYDTAKLQVEGALAVAPKSLEAQDLSRRIDQLPKIMGLLEKVRVARTENNAEKELAALKDVVTLDPKRIELKGRIHALELELKERLFSDHISRGLENVEQRNLRRSRLNHREAKKVYPKRPEISFLGKKIATLASQLALEDLIGKAQAAMAKDDWQMASDVFLKARKKHPNNQQIIDGGQLASAVLSAKAGISHHLNDPYRLTAPNVSAEAKKLIIQAIPLGKVSPSLYGQAKKLEKAVTDFARKIVVRITSDNQTSILVRGVGKVGTTFGRDIELKPGTYTFEGIREGYRAKLVTVRIPVGRDVFDIEIVCDERI